MHNASRKTRRLSVLLLFILFVSTSLFAQKDFRVVRKTPESVTVRFSFPAIAVDPDSILADFEQAGFRFIQDGDDPLFPAAVYYLPEAAGSGDWQITETIDQDLSPSAARAILQALARMDSTAAPADRVHPYPARLVDLKSLGRVRGHELRALYVFPWQLQGQGKVRALKSLTLRLRVGRATALPDSLLLAHTPRKLITDPPPVRRRNPKALRTSQSEPGTNLAQGFFGAGQIFTIDFSIFVVIYSIVANLLAWKVFFTNRRIYASRIITISFSIFISNC
jgi:uncharacterized membrane protein